MLETRKHVFFPGLNGLRFLAAFAVIITHIELLKGAFGFQHMWKHPLFFNLGGLGVYFFFVLSGFLITYLLFSEKEVLNTINVRSFYLRRILRIWPLYYLVLIIGFFVLPQFDIINISYLEKSFSENFWSQFVLYLFILPNLAFSIFSAVPHVGQAWSIGVEEQFYLFWPLLVKYTRKYLAVFLVLIAVILSVKAGVLMLTKLYPQNVTIEAVKKLVAMSKFECMALGSIGAYFLYYKKHLVEKYVYSQWLHLLCWLMIPVLIFFTPEVIQDGIHLVYSILFIIIILNIASAPNSFVKLETPLFNFLGKISYGLYMYHMMIIPIVLVTLRAFLIPSTNIWVINIIIYSSVILLTILVSALSYKHFETAFIYTKKKYSIVTSGQFNE